MNPCQLGVGIGREDLVEFDRKVFCSRDKIRKERERVEIGVIERLEQVLFRERVKVRKIRDHTGCGINRTGEGNLHSVVMSMAIRVVAFTEGEAIRFIGERL